MKIPRWPLAWMAALPIVLTACGPATPSVGMWDFAIAERDVRLAPGEEVALTLDVVAGAGALRGATWTSTDSGVASVDAEGVVRGVGGGTAEIRAISLENAAFQDAIPVVVVTAPPVPSPDEALIDGEPVAIEREVDGNAMTIESEGLGLALGGTDENGQPLPIAPSDGVIRAPANGAIRFSASGFLPNTIVDLWLNSDPILLGSPVADDGGTIDTDLAFPEGTPEGEHTLVVEGTDSEGRNRIVGAAMAILPAAEEEPGAAPQPLAVTIDQTDPVRPITDATFGFSATVVAASGADTTVTWSSDDPSVATIDATGLATLIGVGETTIQATTSNALIATTTLWVTAGTTARLAIHVAPVGGVAGEVLPTQPAIRTLDSLGNPVPGPQPVSVRLASEGTLSGTTQILTDADGVAAFTDLVVAGRAGVPLTLTFDSGESSVDADAITLSPAPASSIDVVTPPVGGMSGSPLATQPSVVVRDPFGNQVPEVRSMTIVLLDPDTATLTGTTTLTTDDAGRADWTDLTLTGSTAREYVLRITSGELTTDAAPITLTPGAPVALSLVAIPDGNVTCTPLAAQPAVAITDTFGNLVTDPQAVSVAVVESDATLRGTTSVVSVDGIATFTDLDLNGIPDVLYTLRFTSGNLTIDAPKIRLSAGEAAELDLSTNPVAGESGSPLTTMPIVQVTDACGYPVVYTGNVTVVGASGPGLRLSGTTTVAADQGVAAFTDLSLTGVAGADHVLRFEADALTPVTAIVSPSAGPIAWHTSGITANADALAAAEQATITVTLRDARHATASTETPAIAFLPLAHEDRGSIGSVTALGDGVYQATFTAGDRPGVARIRPTIDGVPINDAVTIDVTGPCDLNVPGDHATIAAAVTAAQPHDVICIAAGNHAVANVALGKALTIRGAQAGVDARLRVDADGQPLDVASETVLVGTGRLFDLNAAHVTIDGVTFADLRHRGIDSYQNPEHFTLRNSIILSTTGSTSGGAIQFGGGANLTAHHFTFERNVTANRGGYALYFGHSVDYGTIRDNLIRGTHLAFGPFGERVGWSIAGNTLDGDIDGTPRTGYGINANLGDVIIRDNVVRSMSVGLGQVSIVGGMIRGNTFEDNGFAALQMWGGEWGSIVSSDVVIVHNDFVHDGVASPDQAHALRLRPGATTDAATFAIYHNRFTAQGVAGSDVWAIRHNMEGVLDATMNDWGNTPMPEAARVGKLIADAGSGLGVTQPRIGAFTPDPTRVNEPGFWPIDIVPANP